MPDIIKIEKDYSNYTVVQVNNMAVKLSAGPAQCISDIFKDALSPKETSRKKTIEAVKTILLENGIPYKTLSENYNCSRSYISNFFAIRESGSEDFKEFLAKQLGYLSWHLFLLENDLLSYGGTE